MFFVKDNCKNHIYGFLHYTYGDFKDRDKQLQEKPEEKHKDFMDLVRYMICENPIYEEKEEELYTPARWDKHRDSNITSYGE
jgi:phage terminase large subunit